MTNWIRSTSTDEQYDNDTALASGYRARDDLKVMQDAAQQSYRQAESDLTGWATNALNGARQQAQAWQQSAESALRGVQSNLAKMQQNYARQRDEAAAEVERFRAQQPTAPDPWGRTQGAATFGEQDDTRAGLPEAPLTTRAAEEAAGEPIGPATERRFAEGIRSGTEAVAESGAPEPIKRAIAAMGPRAAQLVEESAEDQNVGTGALRAVQATGLPVAGALAAAGFPDRPLVPGVQSDTPFLGGATNPVELAYNVVSPAEAVGLGRVARNVGVAALREGAEAVPRLGRAIGEGAQAVGRGLTRAGEAMPEGRMGVVPPDVARRMPGDVRLPDSEDLREAIAAVPGVRITPDGIEIDTVRYQKEAIAGQPVVRGGVFYDAAGDEWAGGYKGAEEYAVEGGQQGISGKTLLRRPLVVGQPTGYFGAPVLDVVDGPGAARAMEDRIRGARQGEAGIDDLAGIFRDYGLPDAEQAAMTLGRYMNGKWHTAAADAINSHAARQAGYDSIIVAWRATDNPATFGTGPARIKELIDLRESHYPTPGGGYTLRPEFQPKAPDAPSGIIDGAAASRRFYHGTGSSFETPDPGKFDADGLYGPGYYLTDDPRVAGSYAEKRAPSTAARGIAQSLLDNARRFAAKATDADTRAGWNSKAARAERQLAELDASGSQMRPVDMPEGMRLLDVDAPASLDEAVRIADALPEGDFRRQFEVRVFPNDERRALNPGLTGDDLYRALQGTTYNKRGVANVLADAGYDGIKYSGGQRIPMRADDGSPIEHTALAIFPESLPKLRNALSGKAGGITNEGDARSSLAAATRPFMARAAETTGERSFDLAAGAGGGVAGAATAPEDATWQERAGRGLVGAALGATSGAHLRSLASRGEALARSGVTSGGRGTIPAKALDRLASAEVPAGAAPIAKTAEQEVARLRLDKFPEDLRPLIQQAAESVNFATGQRRGVIADTAAEAMADDLARTTEQWIRQGKAGRAYNTEEVRALANAVTSQATRVREIGQEQARLAKTGEVSDRVTAQLMIEGDKLAALTALREGSKAEAGRALRAFAQEARLTDDPNEAISRIFARIGGRENALQAAAEYEGMVADGATPMQMAKFWARVDQPPANAEDWFKAIRYNSMLSGPRTFEVNFIGNLLEIPWRLVRDTGASLARGRPEEIASEFTGAYLGAQRGARALMETLAHGISESQALRGDLPVGLAPRVEGVVPKAIASALDAPGRVMSGTDELFRQTAYSMELYRRAARIASARGLHGNAWRDTVAELVDTPSREMMRGAIDTADRMTFKGEMGAVGSWLAQGQKIPVLGNVLMPFLRTVYHLTARGIDRSPLGLIGTGIDVARGAYKGGKIPKGAAPLQERLADNLIGSAAYVYLSQQAMQGNLSGAGPDDKTTRDNLRSEGWQPYSVRIGGNWVSYANWGPLAIPFALAASTAEAGRFRKPDDAWWQTVSDALGRTGKVFTEQTYLSGLGAIYRAVEDPDRYGSQWLTQFMQTLIPYGSAINTVGQALDPLQRQPTKGDIGEALSARLPILRENLSAARDVFGRELPNQYAGGAALSPFRVSIPREGVRRFAGSSGAEEDSRIASAILAYQRWQRSPRENVKPGSEAIALAKRFMGRESQLYETLRERESARFRRQNVDRRQSVAAILEGARP